MVWVVYAPQYGIHANVWAHCLKGHLFLLLGKTLFRRYLSVMLQLEYGKRKSFWELPPRYLAHQRVGLQIDRPDEWNDIAAPRKLKSVLVGKKGGYSWRE